MIFDAKELVEAAVTGLHQVDCFEEDHSDCRTIAVPVALAVLRLIASEARESAGESEPVEPFDAGFHTGYTDVAQMLEDLVKEVEREYTPIRES